MDMMTFDDFIGQLLQLEDFIISDMTFVDESNEEASEFRKRQYTMKMWFSRTSSVNKKRFILGLVSDLRSAYTLSLLLKSIWNCRPKDAVMSVCEAKIWSNYDVTPIDHDRTARPLPSLALCEDADREWFFTLNSELQAMVLCELLTVSGGPLTWEVLKYAKILYTDYKERLIAYTKNNLVMDIPNTSQAKVPQAKSAKDQPIQPPISKTVLTRQAEKDLEIEIANWNIMLKSKRDGLKLEELRVDFKDGTKQTIWKVNRLSDSIDTVDFLQLLPATVAKQILRYLPQAQWSEYAKVNRYWAYLVDDLRTELNSRHRIQMDINKLRDTLIRENVIEDPINVKIQLKKGRASGQRRVKGRKFAHRPHRRVEEEPILDPLLTMYKPIKNMLALTERICVRGAADEGLFHWCDTLQKFEIDKCPEIEKKPELDVCEVCPCTWVTDVLEPTELALYGDSNVISKEKITSSPAIIMEDANYKHYSLWSKDFSNLYRVIKIPANEYPV